jgi:hypothetical protein
MQFGFQQSHVDERVNFRFGYLDDQTAQALPSAFPVQAHAFGSPTRPGNRLIHTFNSHASTIDALSSDRGLTIMMLIEYIGFGAARRGRRAWFFLGIAGWAGPGGYKGESEQVSEGGRKVLGRVLETGRRQVSEGGRKGLGSSLEEGAESVRFSIVQSASHGSPPLSTGPGPAARYLRRLDSGPILTMWILFASSRRCWAASSSSLRIPFASRCLAMTDGA